MMELQKKLLQLKEIGHWDSARRLFRTHNKAIYGFYIQNGAFKNKECVKPDMSNAQWFHCTPEGEPCCPVTWDQNIKLEIKEVDKNEKLT